MRVYLAGPMTGYPEWNFPAFHDAARRLRAAGYQVTSPAEKDEADGFDPKTPMDGFDLRAALEWDVNAVLDSDGVVLLPGWQDSPGAVIEVLAAESVVGAVVTLDQALEIAETGDAPDVAAS